MITGHNRKLLLSKTTLGFESEGVMNPAVISNEAGIHLFYRAVASDGCSNIGYCLLHNATSIAARSAVPVMYPQHSYESEGLEDPRIVMLDDTYVMSYTAYDGVNAMGAIALSTDLKSFTKLGIVVPTLSYHRFAHLASMAGALNEKYKRFNLPHHASERETGQEWVWDKNLVCFPRRIDGKLVFLHRIKPDIQLAMIDQWSDLTEQFWDEYLLRLHEHIFMAPRYRHEVSYLGAGCPPIETPEGWLLIYHGVHDTPDGYVYVACAALLHLEAPFTERARLPYALFKPEADWELHGTVNNVCFPTGSLVVDDELTIYYGAADQHIGCISFHLPTLIKELLLYAIPH